MPLLAITPSGTGTAFVYGTQTSQGGGFSSIISATPPGVNPPIIFEPGPLLTRNNLSVFIIVTGPQPNWGGCQIWGSVDGASYGQLGVMLKGGVQGDLTSNFPSHSDPDTVDSLAVDVSESAGVIPPGSTQDADLGITLAYVDGELVGYSASTLTSPSNYTLATYLRRGMFGSTIGSHASGSNFGLLNGNVFVQTYPPIMVGETVYFKFPSFNNVGGQLQQLSACMAFSYKLTGAGVSPIGPSGTCPVDIGLSAGCSEDWGVLGGPLTSSCDWGMITSASPVLSVDLGVLGR